MKDSHEGEKKRLNPRITKDNAYDISRELDKWLSRRIERRFIYDFDGSIASTLSAILALIPHPMYSEAVRGERKRQAMDIVANLSDKPDESLTYRHKRTLKRAKETINEIDSTAPSEVYPESIKELKAWVSEHLSDKDWEAVLGTIRQRKHKQKKGLYDKAVQIPVSRGVFFTLKELKGNRTWDGLLSDLVAQHKKKEQS
ncbi:hypothetical protein [Zhongshania marina]|uniref:Uncharacterized protein n=1 Tax=Zhongshania marina TaxID=2304603 RepID=A0A2S4HC77_9GAMM|nr:hypothetical protein [Marortus luteolus]POP51539.1 hypothetical protein C0068_16515 [Marortus luteolus]